MLTAHLYAANLTAQFWTVRRYCEQSRERRASQDSQSDARFDEVALRQKSGETKSEIRVRPHMAARKWTTEQRARQAELIRISKPWTTSTGPRTPAGKAVSSKNAVNYSCRELLREMTRTNRALLAHINGMAPPPSYDRTTIDKLLDDVEKAVTVPAKTGKAKTTMQAPSASKKPVIESRQQEQAEHQPG